MAAEKQAAMEQSVEAIIEVDEESDEKVDEETLKDQNGEYVIFKG